MKPTPPQAGTLTKEEWDFPDVPDPEIPDCCLYEYAREAERALWMRANRLLHAELAVIKSRDQTTRRPSPKALQELQDAQREEAHLPPGPTGPSWPLFQGMFDTEAAEIGTARYFTPPAWLSLTTKQRADVGAVIKISRQGRIAESAAIVPIRWQDVNAAIEAFQFLCLPDSPVMPGTISTGAVVALVIDFKNFNDQQICEHFRAALPAFRLHAGSGEEPVRRGKKISDSRAALENLAIMRLRHSLTITEIKELLAGHPFKCWNEGERESDGPQQIREKADKRRERALKFFREHFPDLGPEATPEHWKTALEMGRA